MAEARLYRTEAVVIRRSKRLDIGEADSLVTVFTPHLGKLRLLAKGVRKTTSRLGGHLEQFVRARLLVARGRNLDLITQAETVEAHLALRDDPARNAHAYYCVELLDRLTADHQELYPVWELLLTTLARLGTARSPDTARCTFSLQLLGLLGLRPQLHECVSCQEPLQPVPNFISAHAGGALCPACGRRAPASRPLGVAALKVLRAMERHDWPRLDRLRLDAALLAEIEGTLDAFVHHATERELKSAEMLRLLPELALPSPVGEPVKRHADAS